MNLHLKNSRLYGSMDGIFDVSLSMPQPREEAQVENPLMRTNQEKKFHRGRMVCIRHVSNAAEVEENAEKWYSRPFHKRSKRA